MYVSTRLPLSNPLEAVSPCGRRLNTPHPAPVETDPLGAERRRPAGHRAWLCPASRGQKEELIRVEQWAEIRRMHFVERISIKEIHRRTGRDRKPQALPRAFVLTIRVRRAEGSSGFHARAQAATAITGWRRLRTCEERGPLPVLPRLGAGS
jgi:hypothetical protein